MADLGLDLTGTAVLAMDFQQCVTSNNALAQERDVVRKAAAVLRGARLAGVPVIHIVIQFRKGYPEVSPNTSNRMMRRVREMGRFLIGDKETLIDKSLGPEEGDIIVSRPRANAFYNSELQSILSAKQVHTLVLMGIATNWVVEAAARHAADADYRVIVLEDCCAGVSAKAHEFAIETIFSQIAEVSSSEEFLANLN